VPQVERHAFDTYDKFLETDGEKLKVLPAPEAAKEYYQTGDLYMFDAFQTDVKPEIRRPVINTLYDTFVAIRDDEGEHVKTMVSMQDEAALKNGLPTVLTVIPPQNITQS
jgi:ubiquinol oxidase